MAPATELADQDELPLPSGTSHQQALAKLAPAETIPRELAAAHSIDDFYGKQGILAPSVRLCQILGYASQKTRFLPAPALKMGG